MKTQRLSLSIDEMRRFTRLSTDEQNQFVDSIDNLMNMPPEEAAAIDISRRDPSLLATVRRRIVRRSRGILRRRQRLATLKDASKDEPELTPQAAPEPTPVPGQVTLEGLAPLTILLDDLNILHICDMYNACVYLRDRMSDFYNLAGHHPLYAELNKFCNLFLRTMMRYLHPVYREAREVREYNLDTHRSLMPTVEIDLAEQCPGTRDSVSALTAAYRYM